MLSGTLNGLERIADLFMISVFFILCSLPLFTLAASASAAYYVIIKNVRGHRGGLSASFFRAFRGNIRQTWPLSLVIVGGAVLVSLYYLMGGLFDAESVTFLVYWMVVLVLTLLLAGTALYAIPVAARTHLKSGEILRMGFLMAFKHFLKTLILVVLLAFCVWIVLNVPILILVFPAIFALISSYLLEPILDEYTDPEGLARWHETDEA